MFRCTRDCYLPISSKTLELIKKVRPTIYKVSTSVLPHVYAHLSYGSPIVVKDIDLLRAFLNDVCSE